MHHPRPLDRPFWTPGVLVMLGFIFLGAMALFVRFFFGLGYATNLSNTNPWGLWIGVDVASGVALAAGGFTTAALAHIFGRHAYEAVTRPALLTAALGYTFVAIAVFVDIGRPWAIWKPLFFHNYTSALFEVAMCVMVYLSVLWIEMIPLLAEKWGQKIALLGWLDRKLATFMWVFIILGVVLSCMHQSSLGTLLVIAPTKVHPLWHTPFLPLLFLLSAFSVGYPMVIMETNVATTSLGLHHEMDVLTPLSGFTRVILGVYLALKIWDIMRRGVGALAFDGSLAGNSFLVEMGFGVMLPWILLLFPRVRHSRRGLFSTALLIVGGVILNRVNVFLVSYRPQTQTTAYFPSVSELLVTAGAVATIMFLYRVFATHAPILSAPKQEEMAR